MGKGVRVAMTGDKRGLGKMKEEGRVDEVQDIASKGGQASHGGGRPQQSSQGGQTGQQGQQGGSGVQGEDYFSEFGQKGGQSQSQGQGQEDDPGNLANDPQGTSEAREEGGSK